MLGVVSSLFVQLTHRCHVRQLVLLNLAWRKKKRFSKCLFTNVASQSLGTNAASVTFRESPLALLFDQEDLGQVRSDEDHSGPVQLPPGFLLPVPVVRGGRAAAVHGGAAVTVGGRGGVLRGESNRCLPEK